MNRGWTFERSAARFHVRIEAKALGGGVDVTRVDGTLNRGARTARHIAADSDDRFGIVVTNRSGKSFTVQSGRESEHAEGGAGLLSMAEPGLVGLEAPSGQWVRILLPADALRARAPGVEDLVSRRLDVEATAALRMLAAYAVFALDNEALCDEAVAELAAGHCIDLAALALGARGDEAELARGRGLKAVSLNRVLNRIRKSFTDPGLSAESVARDLSVSPRYVHRLLHETGKSFSERVLDLRLEAALAALARDQTQRVGDIAYGVGFSDLSYFNRCFRRRYGMTPSTARGG
jgi:AraC-like DNA-binding protein